MNTDWAPSGCPALVLGERGLTGPLLEKEARQGNALVNRVLCGGGRRVLVGSINAHRASSRPQRAYVLQEDLTVNKLTKIPGSNQF